MVTQKLICVGSYRKHRGNEVKMKTIDYYTAVVMQSDRVYIKRREQISEELPRIIKMINFAAKIGHSPEWAPAKLLLFPEIFLQGWLRPTPDQSLTFEAQRDQAISIPGEETDVFAQKAVEYGTYIAGTSLELDPEWDKREIIWNTGWIMSPQGRIILKYRKLYPAIFLPGPRSCRVSPHDVYDEYIKKYGKGLNTFFPVVDTEIGKLGYLICTDGFFPEVARGLALNGAEVLLRSSGMVPPSGHPPTNAWEIENRFHAMTNLAYLVGAAPGECISDFEIKSTWGGNSMIVDFNGMLLAKITFPGEGVSSAVINIPALRKRRTSADFKNSLIMLRTEIMNEVYRASICPPNTMSLTTGTAGLSDKKEYLERLMKMGLISPP